MTHSDSQRWAAIFLVAALAVGLAIAAAPYATGLLGIPVLYVMVAPVYNRIRERTSPRVAAGVIVALVVLVLILVGGFAVGVIVAEAQRLGNNVDNDAVFARLSELHFGNIDIGARLEGLSASLTAWVGSSAFGFLGTASRVALNLVISAFGLYYLLLEPGAPWHAVRPYIPFSDLNTEKLWQRFQDITQAALIGTGLTALLHAILTGIGFAMVGLPNAALWGTVTAVFSILPILGSGLVWGPGAIVLMLQHRPVAAVILALWGLVVVGNVDYLIQPMVSRRWGHIHPLVLILGALMGVPYLGILGLLIGPLALSYLFELIQMFREEYGTN